MATEKKIKTSVGRETASQTVARAKAMTAQNTAEKQRTGTISGREKFVGSSYEKDYKAGKYNASPIPVDSITLATPAKLQERPVTEAPPITLSSIAPGLSTQLQGNQYVTTTDTTEGLVNKSNQTQLGNLQAMINDTLNIKPQNLESDYLKREKQAGIQKLQNQVNDYTGQLNNIISERDQNILRVEGQGRGIPDVIIGGQQAQINKEAAIKALPIQAALDTAQGNLQMAQSRLDKLFAIHREDVQNDYNFKKGIVDSLYNFATQSEQSRLNAALADQKEKKDRRLANLQTARQAALMAVETGQANLISSFSALDPNSPTFDQDYNRLLGQVRKPVSTTGTQDWDIKDVGGVLYKYNKRTGEIVTADVGGATGAGMSKPEMNINKYTGLISDIGVATQLADSGVGAGMIERGWKSLFSSNPDYAQLENISNTVKTNLLALSDNPQLKKFFAAPMSDTDTRLLLGAESTLNPNQQTPEEFKKDLKDAADLFARAREAERQAIGDQLQMSVYPGNLIVSPTGEQVEIID